MTRRCLSAVNLPGRRLGVAVLAFGAFLALTLVVQASLPNGTPARPVPQSLWGDLEPTDPPAEPLPSGRDTTGFNEFQNFYWNVPWWMSIDIEGGLIFTIGSQSLQIWDPSTSPGDPQLVGGAQRTALIHRVTGEVATGWPMRDIDLPRGNPNVAAIVGAEMGVTIWDTSNRSSPDNVYQYLGEGNEVHAATIGGRQWAFVGAGSGLLVFDMTRALEYNNCLDDANGSTCPGVFRGRLGGNRTINFVDGTGSFLALSKGFGVEVWNVAGAPSGKLMIDALGSNSVTGVALWRDVDSTALYLGLVVNLGATVEGRIYNVSCLTTGGCSGLGSPVRTLTLSRTSTFVTFSRSGPDAFLYFGSGNRLGGGPQREFLVNVTDPEDAIKTRDITPDGTIVSDGVTVDYWSWYYEGNNGPNDLHGFNNVGPRKGKFLGEYFYRAAWSVFDVHRRTGGLPPAAEFDWASREPDPEQIYPGSLVDFTDLSTGQPDGWSWFFLNGTPSSSTQRHPQGVSFDVTGPYPTTTTVTLTAFNQAGQSDPPRTKELTILDPAPGLAGVDSNVQSATVCQPITFRAQDPTGKSPLTYSWEVLDEQDLTVAGPTTPAQDPSRFVWQTQPSLLTGDYRGKVTISGAEGTEPATATSAPVSLSALPDLPADGAFTPTNDPFIAGEVQFHVTAPGATEWNWDFGDGTTTGWLSDPLEGPNPVHTYDEVGTYEVAVQVRNCTNPDSPITSAALEVDITSIVMLHAEFEATNLKCVHVTFAGLFGEVGKPITFKDLSTGADTYRYDWNGDGTFDTQELSAPVLSHTYTSQGTFSPRLQVSRNNGEESDEFTHIEFTISAPGGGNNPPPPPPPPSGPKIFVSGPFTGTPGTAYEFRATTTGCDPARNGWNWTTSSGQVVGSSNLDTIRVLWPSTGSKTVSASNSGCGNVTGSTRIIISDTTTPPPPDPDDGELKADFTFNPKNPATGQTVVFNGSASTGDPTTYAWNFGDGNKQDTTGSSVQHVYTRPGTYEVSLAVSRPGSCTHFGVCTSLDARKTIVVSGNPVDPQPEESQTTCPDDPDALCFLDGRFKVTVSWTDSMRTGDSGIGKPLASNPLPDQDSTGFFWFFNPNSVDLIVKFLDGASNGSVWFFSGGLSDVEYDIQVEDRSTDPATVKSYENIAGNICGKADTEAFPQSVNLPGGQSVVLTGRRLGGGVENVSAAGVSELTADFTVSPQEPAPGQTVAFDASASTGNPTTYTWKFGDGSPQVDTSDPSVQHVFSKAGTYEVSLTVSRPGNCNNFGICSSQDTRKSVVVSGAPVDPDPDPDPDPGSGDDEPGDDEPGGGEPEGEDPGGTVTGDTSPCQVGPETLCLLDGRFEVSVTWLDSARSGDSGTGRAIPGTQETGYFWFFSPTNVELVVKMIDGHQVNGYFWVFFGALSDVEYDIVVRDTETGLTETFTNAAGNICGQADTQAFE